MNFREIRQKVKKSIGQNITLSLDSVDNDTIRKLKFEGFKVVELDGVYTISFPGSMKNIANTDLKKLSKKIKIRMLMNDSDKLNERIDQIFGFIESSIVKPLMVLCQHCKYHEGSHIEMYIKYNGFPSFYQVLKFNFTLNHLLEDPEFFQKRFAAQVSEVKDILVLHNIIDKNGKEIAPLEVVEIPGPQFSALEDAKIIRFKASDVNDKTMHNFEDEKGAFVGYFRTIEDSKTKYYLERKFFDNLLTDTNEKG